MRKKSLRTGALKVIYIIGATGLIGQECLKQVKELGWEIVISPRIHNNNLLALVNSMKEFKQTYPGYRLALLQAGWSNTARTDYRDAESNFDWVEINTTIATTANELDIFPVFLGTCLERLTNAMDNYTASKKKSSDLLRLQIENCSISWLRLHYVFSIDKQRPRIIKEAISSNRLKKELILHSSQSKHDFISLIDAASAITLILEKQIGGFLDVGSGFLTTNQNLLTSLFPEMIINGDGEREIRNSYQDVADIAALKRYGWNPSETSRLLWKS